MKEYLDIANRMLAFLYTETVYISLLGNPRRLTSTRIRAYTYVSHAL